MIQDPKHPAIEFPDKPVPPEEHIATERAVIAAIGDFAEAIEEERDAKVFVDECTDNDLVDDARERLDNATLALKSAHAALLRAEARSQEIQLHNNLFQVGQLHAQMQRQAGLIQVPGLVKQ